MTAEEFRKSFDAEMTKQGRDIQRTPAGAYKEYSSAVMWSWAQFGFNKGEKA